MDTSDSNISFYERGWCDYWDNYYRNILPNWHPDEIGATILQTDIERIKRDGKGKSHDCVIGISGGVDSSYLTYLAAERFGLRPLLLHVDAGWNSQQAVHNIEHLVDALGLDLQYRGRGLARDARTSSSLFSKRRSHTSTLRRTTRSLPACTISPRSTGSNTS